MSECSRLIDPGRLEPLLGAAQGRFAVDALAECPSTNSLLLERAAAGAPSGSVLVADFQTAGRGSRGRQWLAEHAASLTFSVLWDFGGGMARLSGLSLVVGVAVARALASLGAPGVRLKWPNDILHDDGKLGGILVEVQGSAEVARTVVGIGLNLVLPATVTDPLRAGEFALAPVALGAIVDPLPERHLLFARLLEELAAAFDRFADGGFAALRAEWEALDAWRGRPVQLLRDGRCVLEGLARGADDDGALLVSTPRGVERCLSGDLSLRRL